MSDGKTACNLIINHHFIFYKIFLQINGNCFNAYCYKLQYAHMSCLTNVCYDQKYMLFTISQLCSALALHRIAQCVLRWTILLNKRPKSRLSYTYFLFPLDLHHFSFIATNHFSNSRSLFSFRKLFYFIHWKVCSTNISIYVLR